MYVYVHVCMYVCMYVYTLCVFIPVLVYCSSIIVQLVSCIKFGSMFTNCWSVCMCLCYIDIHSFTVYGIQKVNGSAIVFYKTRSTFTAEID